MIPFLIHPSQFPHPSAALHEPNGLLAASNELTAEWLLHAYRQGIFPWYSSGQPVLWWSPAPRMVLFPQALHIGRSLGKVMRNRTYTIRFDTAFREVMEACAAPRRDGAGTWITGEVLDAYCALHRLGYAHSVETWVDGQLVGGLYGVALGGVFYGESMFATWADASKIAFAHLVPWLEHAGFRLVDCQMRTHHLARFGANEIPRDEFCSHLAAWVDLPCRPNWSQYEYVNQGRAA